MPVVGGVAEADDHPRVTFHRQRLLVLLGDGLHEQRYPQLPGLGVGARQGVREVDLRGAVRRRPPVAQGAADAQFAHRVGADQPLEPVQVPG